jgi:DNA-binding NtrC family response regulator
MLRKTPSITEPRMPMPGFSARSREDLRTPVVLVVSRDGLLRWALYEALTAAHLRVLTCCDEANAREIVPQVRVDFDVALIDDDTWPMTRSERDWLQRRWPDLRIVVLAHPGQDVEHRLDELGLADVVFKPFDVSDIVQVVERIVAMPASTRRAAGRAALPRT